MKQIFILFISFLYTIIAYTQEETKPAFQFTTTKEIPITTVKNQASSGTCWSFSSIGLIEAELLRQGKGTHDLSEMYLVRKSYEDKAKKYVRMAGTINFAGGGSCADILAGIQQYGIVPDAVQPGLNYGEPLHRHGELDMLLKAYVGAVIKNPNKKLSTAWYEGFSGILDAYLGKCPETFDYNGTQYTPQGFAQSLGIRPGDYVSLTSFTHHPFYTSFPIEIPDNWQWSYSYNLPLDELMQVIDRAIEKGYTVAWATDVSEKGFSRKGIAIVPDTEAAESAGSDQARWTGAKEDPVSSLSAPIPEKQITQEMRQEAFDNYETTDDHGMLIYGTAQDQNGTKYYLVKNSWGTKVAYDGIWYASVPYVRYKTINIVVHKDVLSKELTKKIGL